MTGAGGPIPTSPTPTPGSAAEAPPNAGTDDSNPRPASDNLRDTRRFDVDGRSHDLGSDWRAKEPARIPSDTGGCEKLALEIIDKLQGGTVVRISPPGFATTLWVYRGQRVQWNVHYAVLKDGQVYDAWTDRTGEPYDEYMGEWEDAHETTVVARGSLAPNPDSGGYRFTEDG